MNLRKMVKDTWCWRFINTKPGKYIKFFILLLLDMVNLGVDWYFYAKVQLIEPGLVYGPPEPSIRWTILAFCTISIFSFIIETTQNADDLFIKRKIPFLTQSLSNFLVIFFEDIPLLVLNLIVTLCRDGDPTVISVVKASVGIAVVGIRLVLMILVYWLIDTKKSRFNLVTDIMSTIGLFAIAGLSIAIQLLNNFPTNVNGMIQSADPVQFNRMQYASDKYLKNVGIYTKWPMEDLNQTPDANMKPTDNYLWLADITEVINKTFIGINIRTDYDPNMKNEQDFTLCVLKIDEKVCYSVRSENIALKLDQNETDLILKNSSMLKNGYEMSILKEPAQDNKYKIGYLSYNLNKFESNETSGKHCSKSTALSLIYAKFPALSTSKSISFMKDLNNNAFGFYYLDINLLTVDKFWRTGIVGCKMSGDLGPKLKRDIRLSC